MLLTVYKRIFFLAASYSIQMAVLQNKPLPTWNQVQSRAAHFEGESGSGLESDRTASNLVHVGEMQSYP
jgi:hypothetical protein